MVSKPRGAILRGSAGRSRDGVGAGRVVASATVVPFVRSVVHGVENAAVQSPSDDLPGRVLRELPLQEVQEFRSFIARQILLHVLVECRTVERLEVFYDDERGNPLTEIVIRQTDYGSLDHAGEAGDDVLHLGGVDVLSPPQDQVGPAAAHMQLTT